MPLASLKSAFIGNDFDTSVACCELPDVAVPVGAGLTDSVVVITGARLPDWLATPPSCHDLQPEHMSPSTPAVPTRDPR
jgi:hypothetical protein